MNKVIIVEDRPKRQQIFTQKIGNKLSSYANLTNVNGGEIYDSIKSAISNKDVKNIFEDYSVIMIHRSALSQDDRIFLVEYAKSNNKSLVFFSGGISTVQLLKNGKNDLLTINSKEFYSQNLISFLDNQAENILELSFGENWRLNIVLNTLERLSLYIKQFEKKPFETVKNDLKINDEIEQQFFNLLDKKHLVIKNDLENIQNEIREYIIKIVS